MENNPVLPAAELPNPVAISRNSPFGIVAKPIEYFQPSRLGIIHFLAWMTVAAALMKLDQVWEMFNLPYFENVNSYFLIFQQIRNAFSSILEAALLVGGVVFAIDLCRKKTGSPQPGHWLMGINCFLFLLGIFLHTAILRCVTDNSSHNMYIVLVLFPGVSLIVMLTYIQIAFHVAVRGRWRMLFWILACNEVITFVCCVLLIFVSYWGQESVLIANSCRGLVASFILLVMGIDVAMGVRRDWLHWLGVVTVFADILFDIAWQLALLSILAKH
jgi:hypothetical protein